MSDAYGYRPSGGLKFKGEATHPPKKKKKSSSSHRLRDDPAAASISADKERSLSPAVGNADSPAGSASGTAVVGKTDAQRRFEEVQKKRLLEKAAKAAVKTHKERVAEFNEKLESLSEHYDIPKVGPG